jgi:dTDP-4-dehydrorhamnose reductase
MTRPIVILGGTGFIGRHLVRQVTARGLRAVAPRRSALDVTDLAAAARALRELQPAVVVNCAAATGIGTVETGNSAEILNHIVPRDWAALCDEMGIRLVHFSTDQVFSGDQRSPYSEQDEGAPLSAYGATKYAGERAVLAHPRHLVLRTSFVFGADGNTFMSRLPRMLTSTGQVKVVTGICGSCTHVDRLSEYVVWLIGHEARGLFHVCNRGNVSWEAFAEACWAELRRTGRAGKTIEIERVSYESMKAALGPRAVYSVLDVAKLERTLGRTVPAWTDEIPAFVDSCFASAASS